MAKPKKKRPLSNRDKADLDDIKSYIDLLSTRDREWLLLHYVQPEVRQCFSSEYPSDQMHRIWNRSYLERTCVDGVGSWLQFYWNPKDLPDSKLPAVASSADAKKFLSTLK